LLYKLSIGLDEILKRINMKAYTEEQVDTISGYFAAKVSFSGWQVIYYTIK